MHSRKRGRSGSNKPLAPKKPIWVSHAQKELELIISKLAKEGHNPSKIGIILRDSYGIPSVQLVAGKKIQKILSEKKLLHELPEDLLALMKRAIMLRKHRENNKQDKSALRGLQLTESKIKRLAKHYKTTAKLPVDWKYDPNAVKLYVE